MKRSSADRYFVTVYCVQNGCNCDVSWKNTYMSTLLSTDTKEVSRFGNGRYSALMQECYQDLQKVFKLSEPVAERVAKAIGSEIGAIMANQHVSIKLGSINKDGKLNIAEAAKIKGVAVTNTLMTLRALQYANEAVKNGFNRNDTEWKPIPALAEYFDSLS